MTVDSLKHSRRILLFTQLTIFSCALVAYLNSLGGEFVLDDQIHIVNSMMIRTLDGGISAFWSPMFPGNLYRPLVTLSYAVTYHFFGLEPRAYHVTNLILHALNAVLVFRVLFLFVSLRVSAFTAILFAIAPSNTEAVASVSGRPELLCAFFMLNTLVLVLNEDVLGEKRLAAQRTLSIVVSYLLALCSKESALVLPVLFLVCINARTFSWSSRRSAIRILAILCVVVAIYMGLRWNALGGIWGAAASIDFLDNPLVALAWYERVPNALSLLGRYMLLPIGVDALSADYSYAHISPLLAYDARSVAQMIMALVFVWAALTKKYVSGVVWFACAWFLGAFVVTANIFFPIGTIFAERLAYLPGIGPLLLLVWGLDILRAAPALEIVTFLLIGTRAITLTSLRNIEWRSSDTLYSKQIMLSPESAKTQLNYGVLLREKGDLEGGERHFQRALAIYPRFADAYFNLGLSKALAGDERGGADLLARAIEINSFHVPAIDTLGRYFLRAHEYRKAKEQFERALAINPTYFSARIGLLAALTNLNELDAAKDLYKQLATLDEHNPELLPFKKRFREP